MRCNTSMIMSELGKLLIKRRGGIVPNETITKIQGIVLPLSPFYTHRTNLFIFLFCIIYVAIYYHRIGRISSRLGYYCHY